MNPDFSGEYVLDREASTLSEAGGAGARTGRVRIEHQEPRFRCQLSFVFADGKTFESTFELTTDGREVTDPTPGRASASRMDWDGDALVFSHRGGITLTFRYELLDGGRRLRMSEQLRGTDHDQDNVWVLDRQ